MTNTNQVPAETQKLDNWFGDFISQIKVDHLLMTNEIAPPATKKFYDAIINGDEGSVVSQMRNTSSSYFIKKILVEYVKELTDNGHLPLRLAFGLSDSKLLVWSEIEDDNEDMENALLIAEAKVNGAYQKNGFYISSTIIEKSDNLSVPAHYQIVK